MQIQQMMGRCGGKEGVFSGMGLWFLDFQSERRPKENEKKTPHTRYLEPVVNMHEITYIHICLSCRESSGLGKSGPRVLSLVF